ncbi:hypothetical protein Lepto782_02025 [Leptospira interrogans serovar Canicola]|uniref:Uncharacterized protein n=1 Tax=Leptospira interrogans serovar Canicola TaxID=211880 RepID=A0AAQ0AVY4_LEPIR|nr:hypothetical protein [Leptospira interrogans]QOI41196.1 hypothetical protein Lepto782_02025 [Leptospira interrogans serovar Canicola]
MSPPKGFVPKLQRILRVITTRTHEHSTKLLTAEFTKKIVVLKKYRKFGIYCILKQNQNIQIFETI